MIRSFPLLQRAVHMELVFCQFVNKKLGTRLIQSLFALISRLGDGIFWYGLILLIPFVYGWQGLQTSLMMVAAGVVNLTIYKILKKKTGRERPCTASTQIILGAKPLDHYSFPSGHTLHAVAFSILITHYYPELGWLVIPFAVLVAMSRVILGLHYPTDVLAGAVIGTLTSLAFVVL